MLLTDVSFMFKLRLLLHTLFGKMHMKQKQHSRLDTPTDWHAETMVGTRACGRIAVKHVLSLRLGIEIGCPSNDSQQ